MNILILFVIIIILLQLFLFLKTNKLISKLKEVLSGSYVTSVEDGVTTISYVKNKRDEISVNIEKSINTYLEKNRGAVSDFNLIKDIVERNCDTLEDEIASQTPLPLYLGLMGTVAGIILGLITISLSGGFSNIEKVIEILMSDVAIAMIASFMGIGFTTYTLWQSKKCKVRIESNKNRFYTWIQTNLLPVISKSAVSAITLLQQNLTGFNETFRDTIDRLEEKLGDVGDVYESQLEILDKIEAIDVKRMAVANVKVLAALDGSMGSLERFSQYMSNVTDYLTAVRELNGKLDDHLERTETLSLVSEFYRKQMREIELRQDAMREAVLSVDDVMKSAFSSLQQDSERGLNSMREAFVSQMNAMEEMIARQTEKLTHQMNQMPQAVKKLEEISAIPSKLDKLIDRIEKSNNTLSKQVSQSLNSQSTRGRGVAQVPVQRESSWLKWVMIITIIVIAFSCIANLAVNIFSLKSINEETEKSEKTESTVLKDSINIIPIEKKAVKQHSKSDYPDSLRQNRENDKNKGEESSVKIKERKQESIHSQLRSKGNTN